MKASLALAFAAALARTTTATSPSATHTSTKTGSPSVCSPTQTPSASPIPTLSAETWGYLDTSVPAPTLQPVTLFRSSIDNNLYAQLNNIVTSGFATTAAEVWLAWNATPSAPFPNVSGWDEPLLLAPVRRCFAAAHEHVAHDRGRAFHTRATHSALPHPWRRWRPRAARTPRATAT